MKKICYVATIPHVVFSFLSGHIEAAARDFDVSVISHPTDANLLASLPCRHISLNIQRKIAPYNDLQALFQMIKIFRRERYAIVHSIMPKTGLLSMSAGRLTGIQCRIHTYTGQVWATRKGINRSFLKSFDRLIAGLATHTLADSESQRQFLITEGILKEKQCSVIGNGSICGVDVTRFCPDSGARQAIRDVLKISPDATIILFLGRLNKDKGMLDLAQAFGQIASERKNIFLLLVGAEEDVSYDQIQAICGDDADRLRRILFTSTPEQYMAASDIFCLPSYREGFGQTIIEAAACRVPTVATRIYGITDAVEENQTGLLIEAGAVDQLTQALLQLVDNPLIRSRMGETAKARAEKLFCSSDVTGALIRLYHSMLQL